jgi:hypothetical protein
MSNDVKPADPTGIERTTLLIDLFEWATERLKLETANRPDTNIHKRTLIETWCQVIRKIEEELRLPR